MGISVRRSWERPPAGDGWHPFERVHVDEPDGSQLLALALRSLLYRRRAGTDGLVIVCVGTDRSTGDAFGPLVGSRLAERQLPGVEIRGTLRDPVHATNLAEVVQELASRPRRPLVIAVERLGRAESVGFITVRDRPLQPGTGVHKQLPAVGDLHMVGVVNVGGFMEYFVLQSTRLDLVMRMASVAADALQQAVEWSVAGWVSRRGRASPLRGE